MIDVGLLTALFDYVKPNDSVCSVEWTSAQYEELQLQVRSAEIQFTLQTLLQLQMFCYNFKTGSSMVVTIEFCNLICDVKLCEGYRAVLYLQYYKFRKH